MKQNTKTYLLLIAFGVGLYAALMNLGTVLFVLGKGFGLIMPVLLGLIFAFILSVPMNGFEKLLLRARKGKESKLIRPLSLLLTLASIILVLVVVVTAAIPALVSSVMSVVDLIQARWPEWLALVQERWPEWTAQLSQAGIDLSQVPLWLENLDFEQLFRQLTSGAGTLLSSAVDVATSTVSTLGSCAFALVIAIYMLLDKRSLARQTKKLTYAHLNERWAGRLLHVATLTRDTFSKFLSGQCTEAIILGLLIFFTFTLLRLPYAGLIAMLTGVCAFVPYVGAFAACVIGTFLTLLVDPIKAVVCLATYLIVQFVETQFIYPHVVGGSIGLSPLWTLIAALVGGNLFGLFGMVFFVPLTAVVYTLIRESTNRRLERRKTAAGQKEEV